MSRQISFGAGWHQGTFLNLDLLTLIVDNVEVDIQDEVPWSNKKFSKSQFRTLGAFKSNGSKWPKDKIIRQGLVEHIIGKISWLNTTKTSGHNVIYLIIWERLQTNKGFELDVTNRINTTSKLNKTNRLLCNHQVSFEPKRHFYKMTVTLLVKWQIIITHTRMEIFRWN